ncbi:MAG: glycosyltransferase family 4 protein, partial [Terriglobales bacterium]
MRILMTSDGVGGLGVFASELARALARHGHRVKLVQLGPPAPLPPNLGEGVEPVHLPGPLEWMRDAGDAASLESRQLGDAPSASGRPLPGSDARPQPDQREGGSSKRWPCHAQLARTQSELAALARSWRAELIHANHFAFAACTPGTPAVLGIHSDLVSWWRTVRGLPPPHDAFHGWYRTLVHTALQRAQAVVAPTQAALDDLRSSFGFDRGEVIPHGCAPEQFRCGLKKKQAVTLGRLWDPAKQISLLRRSDLAMPVAVAGELHPPGSGAAGLRGPRRAAVTDGSAGREAGGPRLMEIEFLGPLPRSEVIGLLARARVYIATSGYEPFGLAPLEAAFCGCALLLNDLPSFREVWG